MKIFCQDTDTMIEVYFKLMKEGATFETTQNTVGWTVELTGGY